MSEMNLEIPVKIFVDNLPDAQHCTASGPVLEPVKKDKSNSVSFQINLADTDNEQCILLQNSIVSVSIKVFGEQIPVTVISESASVYHVSYIPAVAGEMRVSVRVNGSHIKNSPWTVLVDNPPDLSRSVVVLTGNPWEPQRLALTSSSHLHVWKDKTQVVTADIYLVDSYNEPCVFKQNISTDIMVSVIPSMVQSTGERMYPDVICKSLSHYQVCLIPDKPGEWNVITEVNGISCFGSSLILTIDNPPSIEHCKVYDISKKIIICYGQ